VPLCDASAGNRPKTQDYESFAPQRHANRQSFRKKPLQKLILGAKFQVQPASEAKQAHWRVAR
jgi:hypothetical protein